MKSLFKRSFVSLHLATLAILVTLISVPLFALSVAHAETSVSLSSGLTYINQQNLQSNQSTLSSGTSTASRSGWEVGLRGSWQQLNANGGYAVNGQASLDQGFDGRGEIRTAALDGSWTHALSQNWLMRLNARLSSYQDEEQPSYSNRTGGGGLTLGWFGPRNSGLDLSAHGQKERYDDNPGLAYEADRYTLTSRYYFGHKRQSAYWSIGLGAARFDASQIAGYSYDSRSLSLTYNAWRWQKLNASLQFQWRNNRYAETTTNSPPPSPMPGMGTPSRPRPGANTTSSEAQNDTYLTTALNLSYPLGKQWLISANLNAGQYRSNLAADRPLISAYVGISINY